MEPLPPAQLGDHVWDANTVEEVTPWALKISPDELAAVSAWADEVLSTTISQDDGISLQTLERVAAAHASEQFSVRLRDISQSQLLHGRGFVLLSSLPVALWGPQKCAAAALLIARQLGPLRQQNAAGHVLGHVTDLGKTSADPNARVYQTHERQTFHTDSCDIVGLLCMCVAKEGGSSSVVSASAIFNAMREARPDLLRLLLEPLATDRRGEVPPGAQPFFLIPVFNLLGSELTVMYQRQYIDSAQRFPDAPRLTAAHIEALDMFDALANSPQLQCNMQLQPGDLQFVHNHSLLHDRSAFVDLPEPERRRHLLRVWIAAEGARALPACFAQRYGSIEVGARGGVALQCVDGVANWRRPQREKV